MDLMEELMSNNYIYLLNNGIDLKVSIHHMYWMHLNKKNKKEQMHSIKQY